jgi:hypothetical protein
MTGQESMPASCCKFLFSTAPIKRPLISNRNLRTALFWNADYRGIEEPQDSSAASRNRACMLESPNYGDVFHTLHRAESL